MSKDIVVALYARVSSDQQAKNGTIGNQIESLREKIIADGETLIDEMMFVDKGVSGATLIRPQLERLRDTAALGLIDRLYMLSPDRLSRKYAHQVLLMEEFSAMGIEVYFLNHAIGATPEEELLLQMQGMISEYERAKIMERNRRGKIHRAKGGSVNVLSNAPYGYRYIRKQLDGEPAQYMINLPEASTVRQIFHWVGVDRLSIGEVCRRLGDAGIETKSGKNYWDRSVVWGMLQNPAYMGRAAFGKTQVRSLRSRVRPQKHSAETPKKPYSVERTNRESWIEIPVPAIISEELFLAVQYQLDENRKRARQRRRGAAYLLQGLTVCGHCHYAYYGKKVSTSASKGKKPYAYYRCIGTDAYRFGGQRICNNPQVRTSRLDDLVWKEVVDVLQHPERLEKEYERRLDIVEQAEKDKYDTAALECRKRQLDKGKSRLIDSYTEGVIDKEDFESKIGQLKIKLQQLERQIEECKQHTVSQFELFLVISRLEDFASTVKDRLDSIDFNTKRDIIRALVKRVEIYKDEVIVVFRVEPKSSMQSNNSGMEIKTGDSIMQDCKGRNHPALWCSLVRIFQSILFHNTCVQPFSDQS
jgi:site-specific DNA recombinase